jgi:hypothetical protein
MRGSHAAARREIAPMMVRGPDGESIPRWVVINRECDAIMSRAAATRAARAVRMLVRELRAWAAVISKRNREPFELACELEDPLNVFNGLR